MNKNDIKIACLVAAGSGLQIAENVIPYPAAGVRIGFANIVTVYAVNNLSFRQALAVAVLRPVTAASAAGWLATPLFVFSFLGSIASFFSMSLAKKVFGKAFSNVGLSIIGSLSHVAAQLCFFSLFAPLDAVLFLLPVLLGVSVFSGIVTGGMVNRFENAGIASDAGILSKMSPAPAIPGLSGKTILKAAAGVVFILFLMFVSNLNYVYFIILASFTAASVINFTGVKKTILPVVPVFAAIFLFNAASAQALLKFLSLIFFSIAVSDRKNNFELLTVFFSLLRPAEKAGVPVTRLYSITMVCLQSNWAGLAKNAVVRLIIPATK